MLMPFASLIIKTILPYLCRSIRTGSCKNYELLKDSLVGDLRFNKEINTNNYLFELRI